MRTRAILQLARDHSAIVRVPAPVLAEVCRSPRFCEDALGRALGLDAARESPVHVLLFGRARGVA